MNADLFNIAELAYNHSKHMVEVEGIDELMPSFLSLREGGKLDIIMTPFGSEFEKELTAIALKEKFQEENVQAYIHVSEAWMLVVDGKDADAYMADKDRVPPSKSDRRQEVVIIAGQSKDGGHLFANVEIRRDDNNRRTLGEFKPTINEGQLGGMFATLLNEEED